MSASGLAATFMASWTRAGSIIETGAATAGLSDIGERDE